MNDFWNEYYKSVIPQESKITVYWDTCCVGNYDSVEEARIKCMSSEAYKDDSSDFYYVCFPAKERFQLYSKEDAAERTATSLEN